jgi:hypothetical protein
MLDGLRKPTELIVIVVTLLSANCRKQASPQLKNLSPLKTHTTTL